MYLAWIIEYRVSGINTVLAAQMNPPQLYEQNIEVQLFG